MSNHVEFIKSGPNQWTARNNSFTIQRLSSTWFIVRDGHGQQVGRNATSLRMAKMIADNNA